MAPAKKKGRKRLSTTKHKNVSIKMKEISNLAISLEALDM